MLDKCRSECSTTAAVAACDVAEVAAPDVVVIAEVAAPEVVIVAAPNTIVPYNPKDFQFKLVCGVHEERKPGAMREAMRYYTRELSSAFDKAPTEEQKLLVLHSWLRKRSLTDAAVSQALRSVVFGMEGIDIIQTLKEIWAFADSADRKRYADSIGFQRTFLMAVAPTNQQPSTKAIRQLGKMLGVKSRSFQFQFKRALETRSDLMFSHNTSTPMLQRFSRKNKSIVTPELLVQLEDWLMNDCDEIVASPNAKDSVLCLDPGTGLKERKPKYYYLSSMREVHNALLESFPPAKSADGKVLISDTMLRTLAPRWLSRMTDSHKEMCGCEPCIIVKQFMRTVVAWIRVYCTSYTDCDPDEMSEMRYFFLKPTSAGSLAPKYDHPRQILSLMTCPAASTEHKGLYPMKCALGRCEDCPDLNLPALMKSTGAGARLIAYQDYKYHSYCTVHTSLLGAPTKCPECAELEEGKTKGKLLWKKHLTRNKATIGDFMSDIFVPMFQNYKYHLLHVMLLGKNYCVKCRKEAYLKIPGSSLWQRDFADRLVAAFTDQIQSTHFGENASLSMEGLTARWAPENFHYHSFLADNSLQDSRTVFVNTVQLIKFLKQAPSNLFTEGSWLFELMDGCAKQYRSSTALYLMTTVLVMFRIVLDRMIQAPHHGKGDCDSQGGIDKNYLRRYFRRAVAPEENTTKKGIQAHTVGEDGVRASMAERLAVILQDPSRTHGGSKGDKKHAIREGNRKIQQRHYHVVHNGRTDMPTNVEMPLENTKFKAVGFKSKKDERYNGSHACASSNFETAPWI